MGLGEGSVRDLEHVIAQVGVFDEIRKQQYLRGAGMLHVRGGLPNVSHELFDGYTSRDPRDFAAELVRVRRRR